METQVVKEAVDALGKSFHDFKQANDERLLGLEKKAILDPLLEEKVDQLNNAVDKAQERVEILETAQRRPDLEMEAKVPNGSDGNYKAAFLHYVRKGVEEPLQQFESKALSSGSDPEGGYLVPTEISQALLGSLEEFSSFRKLAKVTSISTDMLEVLVDAQTAEAGWVSEENPRSETNVSDFAKVRIPVNEIYAKPCVTQKLLEDAAIDIEKWLINKVSRRMAQLENQAFINGLGGGQPMGFLSYNLAAPEGKEVIEETKTGVAGDFDINAGGNVLFDVISALPSQYLSEATWLMSRLTQSKIRKLKDGTGQYLWQPGLIQGTPSTLLGHPVVTIDEMPSLEEGKKSHAIAFGNFREGYQIVDRQDLHVLRDPYSAKPYVEFYMTKRVGGDVINPKAIKLINFS